MTKYKSNLRTNQGLSSPACLCYSRSCKICHRHWSQRAFARKWRKLERINEAGLAFITLTVPAQRYPSLGRLKRAFRVFRRKANLRWGLVRFALDGKDGRWHPHIHAIIAAGDLSEAQVRRLWHQITGGQQVRVEPVYDKRGLLNYLLKRDRVALEMIPSWERATSGVRILEEWGDVGALLINSYTSVREYLSVSGFSALQAKSFRIASSCKAGAKFLVCAMLRRPTISPRVYNARASPLRASSVLSPGCTLLAKRRRRFGVGTAPGCDLVIEQWR